MKTRLISLALWLANAHAKCAAFWNDVAESFLTARPLSTIRKDREDEQ